MDDRDGAILLHFFDQADMGQSVVPSHIAMSIIGVMEEHQIARHRPPAGVDSPPSLGESIDGGDSIVARSRIGEEIDSDLVEDGAHQTGAVIRIALSAEMDAVL